MSGWSVAMSMVVHLLDLVFCSDAESSSASIDHMPTSLVLLRWQSIHAPLPNVDMSVLRNLQRLAADAIRQGYSG